MTNDPKKDLEEKKRKQREAEGQPEEDTKPDNPIPKQKDEKEK